MQWITRAFSFARDNAGNNSDARMAIMAITTSSSISVKAPATRVDTGEPDLFIQFLFFPPTLIMFRLAIFVKRRPAHEAQL
jgi:hypothetical protein